MPFSRLLSLYVLISLMFNLATVYAGVYRQGPYKLCFTPGANCTQVIEQEIQSAKTSIYMQAYSFTSKPIADALIHASRKGVKVAIIIDKTARQQKTKFMVQYLRQNGLPIWVDYRPAIAHNKVIIIDRQSIITGSFNFTNAAQYRNAENLLVVHDPALAEQYLLNWHKRQTLAKSYAGKQTQDERSYNLSTWLDKTFYRLLQQLLKAIARSLN
jgi:phospholipase D